METLNNIFNAAFDLFFLPFRSLGPLWGLSAISLLTALVALPIFKYTSNQRAIKRIKSILMGHIIELWLYRDEIGIVLRAQGNILRRNFVYMGHMLKPLVFMVIPVALILVQTEIRYAHRPLRQGESAIVKVTVDGAGAKAGPGGGAELRAPEGLVIDTPALRAEGGVTYWRIHAESPGTYDLHVLYAGEEALKTVHAADGAMRIEPNSARGASITAALLHPGEPPLPADLSIESIEVRYPDREISIFGHKVHWLMAYFILTLVFSFALLKPFRVRI